MKKQIETLDNAEKLMWRYLVDHGGVVESRGYYGTSMNFSETTKSQSCIKEFGIDWEKTTGVKDNFSEEFNGTFDEPAKVTFLEGTLVTNDGARWEWYLSYDEPINILELIKDIIPDPFAL